MGPIVIQREQAFFVDFGAGSFLIVPIIVGRKNGVFTRTHRMMNGVVAAATAQAGEDARTFAAGSMVRDSARQLPVNEACPRQERTGESYANKHFGDRLHILSAKLSRAGKGDTILLGRCQPRFRLFGVLQTAHLSIILKYTIAEMLLKGHLVTFSSGGFVVLPFPSPIAERDVSVAA